MSIAIHPLGNRFAAEVSGPDPSRAIDADSIAAIRHAIDEYCVLVFRDQPLSDLQLHDFAARFGPLEIGRAAARPGRRRLSIPQIGDISNLNEDNRAGQSHLTFGRFSAKCSKPSTGLKPRRRMTVSAVFRKAAST